MLNFPQGQHVKGENNNKKEEITHTEEFIAFAVNLKIELRCKEQRNKNVFSIWSRKDFIRIAVYIYCSKDTAAHFLILAKIQNKILVKN